MRILRACSLLALSAAIASGQEKFTARIRMRDGVRLAANIYLAQAQRRMPSLLIRTPYGKGLVLYPGYRFFVDNGYALVIQDVRGRYESEGVFRPLTQEVRDGYDTLAWIAAQPWSNGRIGMFGGSYRGIVQWRAAISQSPHLNAISPVVSGYDEYRDRFYSAGGALKLGHRLLWLSENMRTPGFARPPFSVFTQHLPLRTADFAATGRTVDFWQTALDHPTYDSFWKSVSTREHLDRVRVPVLSITGWYDNFAESDLEAFSALSKRGNMNRIVVGPWGHDMSIKIDADFGRDSSAPVRRYQLDWFDQWLKAKPPRELPAPVRIFVMGLNRWRDELEWPLRRTRWQSFYLASRASARSVHGDGVLATEPRGKDSDQFTYNPRTPVPTLGGAVCCNPRYFPWGPKDQRDVEARNDVLVYTTPPLARDLEATGPVRVVLYVSTSVPDTDFTAKLVDVHPDGYARNLCDGILRLRYRDGLEKAVLARPGEVYKIVIEAGVTSNVFLAGHRIRLEVSSSNFPRFDRNLNTGRLNSDETEMRVAQQTVLHGRNHPSHLLLPVVP